MLDFLTRVTDYLEKLIDANKALLVALKDYQKLLVESRLESMEKSSTVIDRLTGRIRIIDEERRAYVDDYFRSNSWDGPRNFSAITEMVKANGVSDEEARMFDRAADARMTLIGLLAEVDAQNSLNMTIVGQGMHFAEVSLRALFGHADGSSTYGPSDDDNQGPSILDAQV